jgi:hypothetical protein
MTIPPLVYLVERKRQAQSASKGLILTYSAAVVLMIFYSIQSAITAPQLVNQMHGADFWVYIIWVVDVIVVVLSFLPAARLRYLVRNQK